jgi:Ca2+-binding RTX toxin-like protein
MCTAAFGGVVDTLVSIEVVYGSGQADTVNGNVTANDLYGGFGADVVNGRAGSDALFGQFDSDVLSGGSGDDRIEGDYGHDFLDGGDGDDTLIGGRGNDTYVGDAVGDVIIEAVGEGTDEVRTLLASYTLGANLEKLTYVGSSAFMGAGNTLANTITGGVGDDALTGAGGADTLAGGAGRDLLTGGASGDTFVFAVGGSGITASTADTITDWATSHRIDTPISGAAGNYQERATTATTIEAAAAYAESQVTNTAVAHVFLYNMTANKGFLLSDLDNDDVFEAGAILTGADAAADFAYGNLI